LVPGQRGLVALRHRRVKVCLHRQSPRHACRPPQRFGVSETLLIRRTAGDREGDHLSAPIPAGTMECTSASQGCQAQGGTSGTTRCSGAAGRPVPRGRKQAPSASACGSAQKLRTSLEYCSRYESSGPMTCRALACQPCLPRRWLTVSLVVRFGSAHHASRSARSSLHEAPRVAGTGLARPAARLCAHAALGAVASGVLDGVYQRKARALLRQRHLLAGRCLLKCQVFSNKC